MTQYHITHAFELPACKAGHRARHIHDLRCARAGGGHFIECACSQTRRFADFETAMADWKRLYAKRVRTRRPPAAADGVLQFPLQLAGRARHG